MYVTTQTSQVTKYRQGIDAHVHVKKMSLVAVGGTEGGKPQQKQDTVKHVHPGKGQLTAGAVCSLRTSKICRCTGAPSSLKLPLSPLPHVMRLAAWQWTWPLLRTRLLSNSMVTAILEADLDKMFCVLHLTVFVRTARDRKKYITVNGRCTERVLTLLKK